MFTIQIQFLNTSHVTNSTLNGLDSLTWQPTQVISPEVCQSSAAECIHTSYENRARRSHEISLALKQIFKVNVSVRFFGFRLL